MFLPLKNSLQIGILSFIAGFVFESLMYPFENNLFWRAFRSLHHAYLAINISDKGKYM